MDYISLTDMHHRRSIRLKGFDYRNTGRYFVTICAKRKQHLFGNILDGTMGLNEWGIIAYTSWRGLPDHFSQVFIDEFVVMPNHLHGILLINSDMCRGRACSAPTNDIELRQKFQRRHFAVELDHCHSSGSSVSSESS